jgi:hypothetical protein
VFLRTTPLLASAELPGAASRLLTRVKNNDPLSEPPGSFDNPEQRPLGERCILGFGSTSGPPALPDYFYNDLHQT